MTKYIVKSCFVVLLLLAVAFALQVPAARAASTVTLKVQIATDNASKNDTVLLTDTLGNTLATCQSAGSQTKTCKVQVSMQKGVVLSAQPDLGEAFQSFSGANCQYAPGPVCHVQMYASNRTVTVQFGAATAGPIVTTTSPVALGQSSACTYGNGTVTVNGSGFAANSPATLSDDGTQVASGSTDGSGFAQLSYNASSEPGVYRQLTMSVAGQSVSTDVYNGGTFCWSVTGTGSGTITITVAENDLDANKVETHFQFGSNTPVPLKFGGAANAQAGIGQGHASYACPSGQAASFVLYGKRGVNTPSAYSYSITVSFTC